MYYEYVDIVKRAPNNQEMQKLTPCSSKCILHIAQTEFGNMI